VTKPRFGANVDRNQHEITTALERVGCKVLVLDVSLAGCPDLLVGRFGNLYLLEVKNPAGRNHVEADQAFEHVSWKVVGVRVRIVRSISEALDAVGITGPEAEDNKAAMREMAERLKKEPRRSKFIFGSKLQPAVKRFPAR
jgi:hypothetical protein